MHLVLPLHTPLCSFTVEFLVSHRRKQAHSKVKQLHTERRTTTTNAQGGEANPDGEESHGHEHTARWGSSAQREESRPQARREVRQLRTETGARAACVEVSEGAGPVSNASATHGREGHDMVRGHHTGPAEQPPHHETSLGSFMIVSLHQDSEDPTVGHWAQKQGLQRAGPKNE